MRYAALVVTALVLVSCNRDPQHLKQEYLKLGNGFFKAGRAREAGIYYRKAIAEDRRFGEAWYRLALNDLKNGSPTAALRSLYVAKELLKPGTTESRDAILKLSEILVAGARQTDNNDAVIGEVRANADGFLNDNPSSWEGHDLLADLATLEVRKLISARKTPDAKKTLSAAISEYRTALSEKPGDYSVSIALSRALIYDGQLSEGENILTALTYKEKQNGIAYIELYQLYDAQRRLPECEAVLKKAIQNVPKDPALRAELARYYLVTNRPVDLLKVLTQMQTDLTQFPDAYIQTGDFFLRANRFDEAIKQYEAGIARDPGNKIVYLKSEVEAYARSSRMQLATARNEEILRIDGRDPEGRGFRATLFLDTGAYGSAVTELQSVVTARPRNYAAHFNLGRAYLGKGDKEQARQEFGKAAQLRPDSAMARLAQTLVAFLEGDVDGALRDADDLLRMVPDSVEGMVMKAGALQRAGKYAAARQVLDPALGKTPNAVPLLFERGVIDLQQNKTKDAVDIFRKAYREDSGNIRGLLGESRALSADGRLDESVEVVRTEARRYPDRVDLQRELGNAQAAAGHFGEAITTYQALLAKLKGPKEQAGLLAQIGQAYRDLGDVKNSITAFEKSRRGLPDNPVTVRDLGMLYEELGRKDVAKQYYARALELDAGDPLTLNCMAWLLAGNSDDLDEALAHTQRAKQNYERILKLDAVDPVDLNRLAGFLGGNNADLNDALSFARSAKRRLPSDAEIADTAAWIFLKKTLPDSSIDNFRSLAAQAPCKPVYHYYFAIALKQKGDRESARRECQTALAYKPTRLQEDQIRRLLAKLG